MMRTKCPIDMKQKVLEREFHKPSLFAKKIKQTNLILTCAQFRLVLPCHFTYVTRLKTQGTSCNKLF